MKALLTLFALCSHIMLSVAQDVKSDSTCMFFATITDSMPRYIAGDQAMLEFIQQNIHYPKLLKNRKIEGTVYVRFFVGKNGMIRDVRVISDRYSHNTRSDGRKKSEDEIRNDKIATAILNKEAIRVVSLLKGFSPGLMNGDPVCVRLGVPVVFKPEHWAK
jgi:hypothetical protein